MTKRDLIPADDASGRLDRAARRRQARRQRRLAGLAAPTGLALGAALLGGTGAQAQAQAIPRLANFANVCTGLSIGLPPLQPVTGLVTTTLSTLGLGGLTTVLNGNFDALSGKQISASVLDANGNPLTSGSPCGLVAGSGFALNNGVGISFGGGVIAGLGGIGSDAATAGDVSGIAVGNRAATSAGAANAIAIGSTSGATSTGAVALGSAASAAAGGSVALGAGSVANRAGLAGAEAFSGTAVASTAGAVSVGSATALRQITNLAGGTQATDAVNLRQLRAVGAGLAASLGGSAGFDAATGAYAGPSYTVNGRAYTTVGAAISALDASTGAAGTIAFLSNNAAGAVLPSAAGLDALAGGYGASAAGAGSTAIGNGATDNGNAGAVALGRNAAVSGAGSVAVGAGAIAAPGNSVALGAATIAARGAETGYTGYAVGARGSAGELAVGTAAAARTVTGVAAGRLGTDAANVGQLNAVGTALAGSLGAAFDPVTGAYTAPVFTTALGTTAATVQGALANETAAITGLGTATAARLGGGTGYSATTGGLSGGFTVNGITYADVATAISGVAGAAAGTAGVIQRTAVSNQVALTVAGGSGTAPGLPQTLTNIAAGIVAAGSTDAVNGGQLAATNQLIAGLSAGGGSIFLSDNAGLAPAAIATGAGASAGGFGSRALGTASTVIGNDATDNANAKSTVLGSGASVSAGLAGSNVALGQGSVAGTGARTNYAAFGIIAAQNSIGTVSVGAAGAERTLSNLAAGTAGTDAVNLAQLTGATAGLGGSVASFLGGGAAYDPVTGGLTAPLYTVAGNGYGSVGDALAAGNRIAVQYATDRTGSPLAAIDLTRSGTLGRISVTGLADATTATGAVTLGQLPVRYVDATGSPSPSTPSNGVGLVGGSAGPVILGNLAAGKVAASSTQAVNGGQLAAVVQSTTAALGGGSAVNLDGTLAAPRYSIAGGTFSDIGAALAALDGAAGSGRPAAFAADNVAGAVAASASGANASAGGFGASAAGAASTVIGSNASDRGNVAALVLGAGSSVSVAGGVALGAGSTAARAALAGGAEAFSGTAVSSTSGGVSVGAAGQERQITDLAGGTQATDAVNLRQLRAVGTGLAASLGGGAGFDAATGAYIAPIFNTARGTTAVTVQGALANETAAITALGTAVADKLGGGTSYSAATGALTGGFTVNGVTYADIATAISGLAGSGTGTGTGTVTAGVVQRTAVSNQVALTGLSGSGSAPGLPQTLTNLAAGTVAAGSTQAVTGGQLHAGGQSVAAALGGGSRINPDGTVSTPSYSVAGSTYTDVGAALAALAGGVTSGRLGAFAADNTARAGAPSAAGANATAGGFGASAAGAGSTVIGSAAIDNGVMGSTVIGGAASVAAGLAGSNVALGQGSVAGTGARANYAAFGLAVPQSSAGTVSIGAAGAERTLSNLAAGTAGTDAVNLAQLTGAAAGLGGSVAASLGGGAAYDSTTGRLSAPSYTVAGRSYGSVGDALAAGNRAAVQYATDASGNPLAAIDLSKGGTLAPVALTGVAPGTLSAASTDAVNGSQLHATNRTVADLVAGRGGAFVADNAAGAAAPAATGNGAAAGGFGAVAGGARATALGAAATATGANSVALGAGSSDGGLVNVVSVGAAGAERRITNVAAGVNATDAASTGQLTALAARSLSYDTASDGTTDHRSVTLNPTGSGPVTIRNLAAGVNPADAVTVGQLGTAMAGTVQYAANPDGTRSNTLALAGGNAAAPVTVSNVAAGVAATDAVNLGQLQASLAGQYNNLAALSDYQFRSARQSAYSGTAIALATAGIRFDDRPGKVSLGIGASGYHGSAGLAAGLGGTSEDGRWRMNLSAGFSPNNAKGAAGVMGGLSYTFN